MRWCLALNHRHRRHLKSSKHSHYWDWSSLHLRWTRVMKAMSSKFENHFEAASPTTQIGSMMMSGSAMCTTSDQSPRRVQRPIRQIGNCGKEEKIINENEYKSQREMLKFLINYMLVVHVYTLFLSFFSLLAHGKSTSIFWSKKVKISSTHWTQRARANNLRVSITLDEDSRVN